MIIEEYWKDVTIYYVTFKADNVLRKISRTFVLEENLTETEVAKLITARFPHVEQILQVEECENAFLAKELS
ncbi:hypothetical protein I6N95_02705 [Vagococcus sp. BWB3-3]|uniref:Uncharacterized protein n=1 Tax=Vagococcus allomyrinae TaxID=2794353 RepID=A0A940STP3_9ENTE|nr:hypothetical protein [Vagococcus allomyrinae]MBP1039914.1 hypothetical protein [Vagococcus allomyrinae]